MNPYSNLFDDYTRLEVAEHLHEVHEEMALVYKTENPRSRVYPVEKS